MTDTVTLIAGALLTSVGLLALVPFVMRLVHSSSTFAYGSGRLLPALSDVEAFLRPPFPALPEVAVSPEAQPSVDGARDLEELMSHLFGLRMIVSEVTAEVQSVQEVLAGADAEETDVHLYGLGAAPDEEVA